MLESGKWANYSTRSAESLLWSLFYQQMPSEEPRQGNGWLELRRGTHISPSSAPWCRYASWLAIWRRTGNLLELSWLVRQRNYYRVFLGKSIEMLEGSYQIVMRRELESLACSNRFRSQRMSGKCWEVFGKKGMGTACRTHCSGRSSSKYAGVMGTH